MPRAWVCLEGKSGGGVIGRRQGGTDAGWLKVKPVSEFMISVPWIKVILGKFCSLLSVSFYIP